MKTKNKSGVEIIINLLRTTPFTFEFEVKEKPSGLRVIYELTQKQMDALMCKHENEKSK